MFGIINEPRPKRYRTCAKCAYNHKMLGDIHMCVFKRDGLIIEPEEMRTANKCDYFSGEWTTDAYKKVVKVPNPGEKENVMYYCPKCHKEIINFLTCTRMDNNKETTIGHCDHCNAEFELSKLIEKTTHAFSPALDLTTTSGTGDKTHDAVQQKKPVCYTGVIERVNHIRDMLTPQEFTGFCIGNVFQHLSQWREDGGVGELRKASAFLDLAVENEEAIASSCPNG